MRTLIIMRGVPASGKSTLIKSSGLEHYTLSPDTLRLMYQAPIKDENGKWSISQENNGAVWKLLYKLLESRMLTGSSTIIDATHTKSSDFKEYIKLAEKYDYKIYCVDFSDVPLEDLKKRNKQRAEFRQVPDEVIERMFNNIKNNNVPKEVEVLKHEQHLQLWDFILGD